MRRTLSIALCVAAAGGCASSQPQPEPGSPAFIRQQAVDAWAEQCRHRLQPARQLNTVYYNVKGHFLSAHAYCHQLALEYGRRLDVASRR